MQKLVWQNANGDKIDLTSGNYGITQWEGFSNTSLNIQSQQVPFQDGAVFLDALMEQRELSVTLKMQDNGNLEERYRMRRELTHILNPKLGEGYLIYTNDFLSKRIKCVAQIPLFETHNSNDSGTPSASLAWTACEPYWEDAEESEVLISNNESVNIELDTDVPTQFEAEINGDIDDNAELIINGKKIALTEPIPRGLRLNTNVGQKSVKNIAWKSRINYAYGIYAIQFCDDYYWFCGGFFEDTSVSSTVLFKSKDLKNFDVENEMEVVTICAFSCLSMSEELKYGFCGCDCHCYVYNEGHWTFIEDNKRYTGAICLDSRKEVIAVQNGKLCRTTDFENWTVIDESRTYTSLKKIKETINGVLYIGMVKGDDGIYGIADNYTLTKFGVSSKVELMCANGYFYYIEDSSTLKRTSNLITSETCQLVETTNATSYLVDVKFSEELNLYIGVSNTCKVFTSEDGINFYERIRISSERTVSYPGNNIFIKDYNVLVGGTQIGLYNYFEQKKLLVGEMGYTLYIENDIGNLKIDGVYAIFNNGSRYSLPTSPISIASSHNVFAIMDSNGNIYKSDNGTDWIFCIRLVTASGINWDVKEICYSEEFKEWAVTSDVRELFTSKDLINWDSRSGGSGNLSISAGKGCYVICTMYGDVKKILPNGTVILLGESIGRSLSKIIHVPELKIYVVSDGTHLYSYPDYANDWSNWQIIATFQNNSLYRFFYNKKLNAFFAVSDYKIFFSYKGGDWEVYTKVYNYGFRRIFNSKDGVLLVSNANNVIDGIITIVEKDNIIDKLSVDSDMNLSLEEKNIISFLNSNPSSIKITYRQKYIGV